jgi:hypothetical protein
VLDFLEPQVPVEGFLFGSLGVADIAIAVVLRNAAFARYTIDPQCWPATAAYVGRVLAEECFTRLQAFEAIVLRTPIPEQRASLAAAGAPVCAETVGGAVPRRGVVRVP